MHTQAAHRVCVDRFKVAKSAPCRCHATFRPRESTGRESQQQLSSRALAALAATVIATAVNSPVALADEECFGPFCAAADSDMTGIAKGYNDAQKEKLKAVDESFQKSDTLKALLAKSEANRAKNKKDIQNKYCYRQAELGIGDCGGLRYIPGMTKNGRQQTPEWLQKVLGVEVPKVEGEGKTLADLLGPNADQ